jgi:asparagine synthase (glutamine-hydrolysing)
MCGIFAYLQRKNINDGWIKECHKRVNTLKPRGPERYKYIFPSKNIFMGFQRLSIVDLSENADQPFTDKNKNATLMCNGEIYNSKQLTSKYNLPVSSGSDCEVILYMYLKFGIRKTVEELDGVFAFVIYDYNRKEFICARDSYGIRPLFIASTDDYFVLSSELKSLYGLKGVQIFPNGCISSSKLGSNFMIYNYHNKNNNTKYLTDGSSFISPKHTYIDSPLTQIKKDIKNKLIMSIDKRLQSDRKIGCLLSGGLDSSLVTALVNKFSSGNIVTYSVGLEGSVDLEAARKVASFLGTEHHEITFSEELGLRSISSVIQATETWDTTTIRASTPMWLMCKYISENTPDVKVIMSGEGADEVCQGYLYFHNQPNPLEGHKESVRLLRDLLYFDVLRSDRSVSCHGLEVRVPFLDKDFVNFYMSIPPELRCPSKEKGEKWLLRESFEDEKLLPPEILWRRKDGLSDGCSSLNRPWYQIIQEHADKKISDDELKNAFDKYPHCTPMTKESLMFRNIFHSYFPEKDRDKLIPYQWMPKWCEEMLNPSGRLISAFEKRVNPIHMKY